MTQFASKTHPAPKPRPQALDSCSTPLAPQGRFAVFGFRGSILAFGAKRVKNLSHIGLSASTGIYNLRNDAHFQFHTEFKDLATAHNPETLKIVFDTYGNVANKPLNEETSAIYNILQELQGKYAADMDAVGITQWATELQTRNAAFETLVKERFDETAARTTDIVMKQARAQLDEAYRGIVELVNALAVVEGVAAYEAFIKTLNAVIAKYAVKHHHHRHNHTTPNSQPNQTEVSQ
ncbi:hypothetical protein R83H12_00867 [Fibrobacteria bacterium R8-3-H12]